MSTAFLLTGGNIGDRMDYLQKAKEKIEKDCGKITNQSSIYETAAWGKEDQQPFLNQALQIETELSPGNLLKAILQIEKNLGRKRNEKYGPRTIDIDILFFDDEVVDIHGLKIPHPQMQNRRFVLEPLNEIASNKMHPVFDKTIEQLLQECKDSLSVKRFEV